MLTAHSQLRFLGASGCERAPATAGRGPAGPIDDREHPTVKRRTNGRLVLAAMATTTLLLTGCSAGGDDTAGASAQATGSCTAYPDGSAAQSVTVTGDFGKEPTVTFDKPLESAELQTHVVSSGDGETTETGDTVEAVISIFSAETGKLATSTPASFVVDDQNMYPAFNAAIECRPIGSRVVTVVPPDQLFGATGNESLGIAANETVILVTDLRAVTRPPTVQPWTKDVPEVAFDAKGVPTLTLPGTKAPEGVQVKVLKQGDGATVAKGDEVTIDYQGVSWKDGKVFDQSYGKQAATFSTTGVIPGFSAALIGQKVGTQLLVTIPSEYAYPEGSGSDLAGQDLVFLIDIKATGAPSPAPAASPS